MEFFFLFFLFLFLFSSPLFLSTAPPPVAFSSAEPQPASRQTEDVGLLHEPLRALPCPITVAAAQAGLSNKRINILR